MNASPERILNKVQKKVALVGAKRVGKTSLIQRLVNRRFDEKSLTTVGFQVDRWQTAVSDSSIELILWDLAGPDQPEAMPHFYLEGCDAVVLVVDLNDVDYVRLPRIWDLLAATVPGAHKRLLANKVDLISAPEAESHTDRLLPWSPTLVSARTGEGVEVFFHHLAAALIRS